MQEPFLIIKTSEGGKDLNHHFRPPNAGEWTPPEGHPDLIKKQDVKLPPLPIPEKLDLPDDWTPEKPYALQRRHMGLQGFKGAKIGKVNGISPLYVKSAPSEKIKGDPFQNGDLILGIDGSGLRDDPVAHWRDAFYGSRRTDGDWMIKITRWRKGKIETFDFDTREFSKQWGDDGKARLEYRRTEEAKRALEIIERVKTLGKPKP